MLSFCTGSAIKVGQIQVRQDSKGTILICPAHQNQKVNSGSKLPIGATESIGAQDLCYCSLGLNNELAAAKYAVDAESQGGKLVDIGDLLDLISTQFF